MSLTMQRAATPPDGERKILQPLASTLRKSNTWCFGLAATLVALTAFHGVSEHMAEQRRIRNSAVSGMNSLELLNGRSAFRGINTAPYTLVEFGDHECPPCRRTEIPLHAVLARNAGKVKLDFRELPLTNIHAHAEAAAVVAESARAAGKFWKVHDQLFAADLSLPGATDLVLSSNGVHRDTSAGLAQLVKDKVIANQMQLNSTPSFVLCCPSGQVLRLSSLDDLEIALEQR